MRAKYLLGLSLVMLATMANDCTPTVVPNYPYTNTLHIDDGNGDLRYTVDRLYVGGGEWRFFIDWEVRDGWSDDDCIYAFVDTPVFGHSDGRTDACYDSVVAEPIVTARWVEDYSVGSLPIVGQIYLCRDKDWYGDPCVQRNVTFTNQ